MYCCNPKLTYRVINWWFEILSDQHRFYGESIPFGLSLEEALKDPETRGYFSSAQALADYAEILIHLKQKLHARNSPIIVMGGSYGGSKFL